MDILNVSKEPFPEAMMIRDLRAEERLAYFLDSLFELLRISAQCRFIILPFQAREAWLSAIIELQEDRLVALRSAVFEGATESPLTLRDVGLEGPELDAKLFGYAGARTRFHRFGGLLNLRSALRWAKAILSSLTKEFPFGEFLLELIEFIENAVEDTADLQPHAI